jgi:type VI secretion system protein ImpK
MREYGDTFLLAPFREFYKEIIRLKRVVETGAWTAPAAPPAVAAPEPEELPAANGTWLYLPDFIPDGEVVTEADAHTWVAPPGAAGGRWDVAEARRHGSTPTPPGQQLVPSEHARLTTIVWQRLLMLFERQEASAWRYGGTYGAEFYKEAQYVMVALADEVFLHTEWAGRNLWVSNLLETKIFNTHVAGELFFQRLDQLLAERDPVYRDLGAVYLMALSLGFRGKYRGTPGEFKRLAGYRRQLFSFVFRRDPNLTDETRPLFPEAYDHTLRDESKRRLPNPRAWVVLLVAVILAYVAITHGIWVNLTGQLTAATDRLNSAVDEPVNSR